MRRSRSFGGAELGQRDDGSVVGVAFGASAGVGGLAGGVLRRAERGSEDEAFERVVAAEGASEAADLAVASGR